MIREMKFVRQPMSLLLYRDLPHQSVQTQVQKYEVKNHHQKCSHVQMGMEMGTAVVMVMVMLMEEMGQMETETTTEMVKIFQLRR
jgi:hypothetical protein